MTQRAGQWDKTIPLTISEAALSVGRSPATLRLWERQGLLEPSRSEGGWRLFDADNMARLRRVAGLRSEQLNAPAIQRFLGAGSVTHKPDQPPMLGAQLRALRRLRGFTLAQAAAGAEISVSFLSALERNHTGVAAGTVQRLLSFYKSSLSELRRSRSHGLRALTRTESRRVLTGQFPGVRVERLIPGLARMEPQLFHIEPGAGSDRSYSHEGEEFIFVMKGTFEVHLEGLPPYRLRAGDCLYYASTTEHSWRNPGTSATSLLWVNTPPTFFARWASELLTPEQTRSRSRATGNRRRSS